MPPPAEAPPVHSPSDTDELSEASERSGAAAESSRRVGEIVRSTLPAPDAAWGIGLLVAVAAVAIVSQIVSRGVAPALPGVWMGADHAITAIKLGAALSSQLFAVTATMFVMGLTLAVVQGAVPAALRAFSVGVGVLTVLAVVIATMVRLPEISRLVLAVAASTLALACGHVAARYFTSRAPALVGAAVGVGGVARAVAIVVAGRATADKDATLAVVARLAATLSQALVLAAVVIALVWLVTTPRLGRSRGASSVVALAAVLAMAAAGAIAAQVGGDPEAEGAVLLTARTFEQLVARPLPYGPPALYAGLEGLRWLAAAALLILAPRSRAMAAGAALALAAGATLEIPLCAAALVIASLALVLQPGPDLRHDAPPAP